MIELAKYNDEFIIRFSPWGKDDKGQKKPELPTITRTLLYGHYCPECKNVIQAAFLTDSALDIKGYEELNTTILDGNNNRRVIRTSTNPKFKSKYDSTIARRGDKVSAQLIKLKEHFDKHPNEEVWNSFCHFVAYFSFRPDIVLQEMMLESGVDPSYYNIGGISNKDVVDYMKTRGYMKDSYIVVPDFAGKVPDIVLVRRNTYSWALSSFMGTHYKKDKTTPTIPF